MAAVTNGSNAKVPAHMVPLLQTLNRSFVGRKIETVGGTERNTPIVIAGIKHLGLDTIDAIVASAGDSIEDIRIWGVGYAPKTQNGSFGLVDDWQPLTLEVVVRNHGIALDPIRPGIESGSSGSKSSAVDGNGAVKESSLMFIKDSVIRRIVCHFIECMVIGERPDLYKIDLDTVIHYEDQESGLHMVMFDAVPTIGLAFLRKVRHLFPSIRDIVFERKEYTAGANPDMTKSATVMIVSFSRTLLDGGKSSTSGMIRAVPTVRGNRIRFSPY
jgi:hypothetical protein